MLKLVDLGLRRALALEGAARRLKSHVAHSEAPDFVKRELFGSNFNPDDFPGISAYEPEKLIQCVESIGKNDSFRNFFCHSDYDGFSPHLAEYKQTLCNLGINLQPRPSEVQQAFNSLGEQASALHNRL